MWLERWFLKYMVQLGRIGEYSNKGWQVEEVRRENYGVKFWRKLEIEGENERWRIMEYFDVEKKEIFIFFLKQR